MDNVITIFPLILPLLSPLFSYNQVAEKTNSETGVSTTLNGVLRNPVIIPSVALRLIHACGLDIVVLSVVVDCPATKVTPVV